MGSISSKVGLMHESPMSRDKRDENIFYFCTQKLMATANGRK